MMGLPDLSVADQARVRLGNQTMLHTAATIRLAASLGLPVLLENPVSSHLLHVKPSARLTKHKCFARVVLDQCQFGARWRKRTAIFTWSCGHLPALDKRCTGRSSLCSRTSKYHIQLSGTDPVSKRLWTSIAQSYPKRHSASLAKSLSTASDWLHLDRFFKLASGAA